MTEDITSLHTLIGELKSDIRHVLRAVESNKEDMNRLREEVRADTAKIRDDIRETHNGIFSRLTRVERKQATIFAYGTAVLTVMSAVMAAIVPAIIKMFTD